MLRATADGRRAEDWALVLASMGVFCELSWDAGVAVLTVPEHERDRAEAALRAYDVENAPPAQPARGGVAVEVPVASLFGAAVAVVLAAIFAVTGDRDPGVIWFARGSADAARILAGEWWRVVTALGLHADLSHLIGNAAAGLILFTAVGQWVGTGVAAWLMLIAGAAGNALTALVHGGRHDSVGASTATFAAVGALAALQIVAARRDRGRRYRPWAIGAAAVAILGVLGTGARADLFAHLFGLLAGVVVGFGVAFALRRRPGWGVQTALSAAALVAFAGCFALALR